MTHFSSTNIICGLANHALVCQTLPLSFSRFTTSRQLLKYLDVFRVPLEIQQTPQRDSKYHYMTKYLDYVGR